MIEAITASDVFQMNMAPSGKEGDKGTGVPAQSGTASTAPAVHHPPGG
jgi:hypothetical protein